MLQEKVAERLWDLRRARVREGGDGRGDAQNGLPETRGQARPEEGNGDIGIRKVHGEGCLSRKRVEGCVPLKAGLQEGTELPLHCSHLPDR